MCGRYTVRSIQPISELFGISLPPEFRPRFNIAPSQDVPVVRLDKDGQRRLSMVRWGLIPSWSKEPPKVQPINARSENGAHVGHVPPGVRPPPVHPAGR